MLCGNVRGRRENLEDNFVQSLQNDVEFLSSLSEGAPVSFNTDKSVAPRLHPRQTRDNNVQYQLNVEHLRSESDQRDLGVIVDETLKPHRQCAKAAKTAISIMRAIKASFMNITPTLFDKLYGTFIRPHLEYAFQAWRPWLRKDIKLLEDVQRRSTKLVKGPITKS